MVISADLHIVRAWRKLQRPVFLVALIKCHGRQMGFTEDRSLSAFFQNQVVAWVEQK